MSVSDQAWITAAVDDETALKALVLGRSLRRALTTRKIAVVICQPVSEKLRVLLRGEYDQVLKMDGTSEMNGLPLQMHAKIFCWSIPFVRRCIFLDPDTMVVRNCDELFDLTENATWIDKDGNVDTSVLLLHPDLEFFEKILAAIKTQKIHSGKLDSAEKEFGTWLLKSGELRGRLYEKYLIQVANNSQQLLAEDEGEMSIVKFMEPSNHPVSSVLKQNGHSTLDNKKGILEHALDDFWREIYYEDVHEKLVDPPADIMKDPKTHVTHGNKASVEQTQVEPEVPLDFFGVEDPIAIVGMSCRFPGANSVDEYWDVLINGKDCIRKVPDNRWPSAISDEFRDVVAGFLNCPVDEFDGKFFGISPADLHTTDPQQRLLMEVVWEALEDAGINPQTLNGTTTGVFVGSWTTDYRDLINGFSIDSELSEFHRLYLGNSLGGMGGRLSFLLGLTGPNVATESGCSSGMAGIYLACESLRARRCNVALAGGVNLLLHPFKRKHMQSIIASDGRCKTFDEKADGFGRGEGVASLILKRYSDAVKDGDRVLALIRGTGISQEGTSRSFGTPTKECQELAMQAALDNGGLKASDVCYIEAHGTGTMVGDPVEVAAITGVYSKDRTEPLIITSGKTNIGHTESCSGFAGIIKIILSMRHNIIPPHINLETVNPHIKLDAIPAIIPREALKWEPTNGKPRIAGVSSFGITGTDAHIILQEPPKYIPPKLSLELERPQHLMTFSAKSDTGLDEVLQTYFEFLSTQPKSIRLSDLAFTANTGRAHFSYRLALTGKDVPEITKKLKSSISGVKKHIPETKPKVCFLFTGQGSQYEGMAKSLYETCPVFKMNFDKCERVLRTSFGISLLPIIWPENQNENQKDSPLKRSIFSQTSIFCVEYSLMKVWKSWGVEPDYVLGHSLGEFAAATCAGILNLKDALTLVAERSRLIENQKPGQMLVIKADKSKVDKLLEEFLKISEQSNKWLDFAALNSAEQTVLAGPGETIKTFSDFCLAKGLKTTVLEATNAFHSRDMDPMLDEYRKIASKVQYAPGDPSCTYISGMTGNILEESAINSEYWVKHTREKVNFIDASSTVFKEGVRIFLEIGPQPVLSALTMANTSNDSSAGEEIQLLPSLRRKESDWTTILNSLSKLYVSGFPIDWAKFDQFYSRSKVTLPFYPFHRKTYWYDQGRPEGSNSNGISFVPLNPLLGFVIPNPTESKLYQNGINLEKAPYLKDHAIGGKTIFPGAGYLEMCLAAGNASTSIQMDNQKVTMSANPVSVEGLTIEAPLGLEENSTTQMHTTVSVDPENAQTKISIFSHKSSKWIRQATAHFSPLPMTYKANEVTSEPLSSILGRCMKEEIEIGDFYDKLSEVGLQFGPSFRSLKKIWKGGEREMLAEIEIPEDAKEYICHPVVLDALIQSIMVGMKRSVSTLFVPIYIGKTVCFGVKGDSASKYYAHVHWEGDSPDGRSSVLYDDTGKVLAFMTGAQMIETNVVQILKALDNQKLSLPNMYEEAWRPRIGTWKTRTNLKTLGREVLFGKEMSDRFIPCNILTDAKRHLKYLRNELVYMYALRALYDMGWKSETSDKINLEEFVQTFTVLKTQEKFLTRLLNICAEENIFERVSPTMWKVFGNVPPESQVLQRLREIHAEFSALPEGTPEDVRVMSACGEQLGKILQGKASGLSILFPEDRSSDVSAETFYNNTPLFLDGGMFLMQTMLENVFSFYPEMPEEERGIVRCLEIGAGTGSSTRVFLDVLEKYNVKYQYTFSDISPAFFIRAEQTFESFGKKIIYKVCNIEEDPMTQGFSPRSYDFVFASNILHATKDIRSSLQNVRQLLRDSGMMIMVETFEHSRHIDIVFGVLEGFWRFTDTDLRPEYPYLSAEDWCKVIRESGHSRASSFLCYEGIAGGVLSMATDINPIYNIPEEKSHKNWLVFSNAEFFSKHLKSHFVQEGRQIKLISRSNKFSEGKDEFSLRPEVKSDMEALFKYISANELNIEGILYLWGLEEGQEDPLELTQGFMHLAQCLLADFNQQIIPKLIVVTEGIMPIGDQSAVNVAQGTLWGMARSFRSENGNIFLRCIDLDPDEPDLLLKYKELFTEIWIDDNDYQIAYRQSSRHVCRFVPTKDFATPLPLPNSERFSLVLPETKNIADLKFCANGKPTLKDDEVEVQVKVTGLNFRDVFVVLKPDKAFEKYNTVGMEFSGVIIAVGPNVKKVKMGDKVIGCNFKGDALPSHAICEERALTVMPKDMTFHEACTLPAAFATVHYCLVEVAQLQKGETVLIHAGSGGVGLYAIQVANALGAEVITTAGSMRKRAYLRSIGVKHVFHSRNTDYGEQIKECTNGKGVQVVLNCLTSPGFKEASLGVCSEGARFIEISKMAVWSEEDVKALRPDVKYTIVDLTTVSRDTPSVLWEGQKHFYKNKLLTPVPYVNFDVQNIGDALIYMQKAKHIGKVLVTMPESRSLTEAKGVKAEPKTLMFNEDSTYLITGGLGGIGLEVAKWMSESGAKHIVLASRRSPNEACAKIINELIAKGKNIIVKAIDVGDFEQCKELIQSIKEGEGRLPPLRGIMHAAGTLSDATYLNQSKETYATAFRGKVQGAWNLHQLTLDCRLEHFMLFSSIVALFGLIGLSNYAAANTFLDALAHYRNALGLTAQTINWGQWAEVGAAANINIFALRAFTPSQGIAALEVIMKSHKAQACVLEVDFSAVKKLTGHAGAYLEELKITNDVNQPAFNVKIERFWDEYHGAPEDKKRDVLKSYIEIILRQILKFDDDEVIDEHQAFSEMGMDSLMMLEMKNFVQTMLGKNVTMNVSVMQELTSVSKLVNHLMDLIAEMDDNEGNHPLGPVNYDQFSDEMIELINKDMVLPEHIKPSEGADPPINRSEVKQILLTGVTGKFGPFVLQAIFQTNPNIEKVYCLIRSKVSSNNKERLNKALDDLKMLDTIDMSKVEVVTGDITEKMFGLPKPEWDQLGEKIDSIFHCAVKGNLMDPYTRLSSGKETVSKGSDIRTPNVIGTLNVLELAVHLKTKSVFHASTLLCNNKFNAEDNTMSEEWYLPEEVYQLKNVGYPVSKFICEVLMHQAVDRGIPVHVFRFPALFGDSINGRFVLANNHAVIRLLGFCKLGAIPAIPLPIQVLPSDSAALLTCKVFFMDESPLGVYNLSNPHLNLFHDIAKVSGEQGFPIEVVEYDVFAKKLSENEDYRSLFPYSEVDMEEGRYVDFSTSPQALQAWLKNPDGFFPSKRMLSIFPDLFDILEPPVTTVKRDLQFAIDSGICKKFGIKRVLA